MAGKWKWFGIAERDGEKKEFDLEVEAVQKSHADFSIAGYKQLLESEGWVFSYSKTRKTKKRR